MTLGTRATGHLRILNCNVAMDIQTHTRDAYTGDNVAATAASAALIVYGVVNQLAPVAAAIEDRCDRWDWRSARARLR